jgi:23S rRNA pseudouridine1911/1915/1917 synthase
VNGRRARKGTIVRAGDTITVAAPTRPPAPTTPAPPLVAVHEDDELVAVDKPPGLPTTIARVPGPSLAALLLARFPEMATLDAHGHAGLAHRLDTGTSGLLIAARRADVHARLRDAFARKAVQKDYLAVVVGRVTTSHVVTAPLARHRRSRNRMVVARAAHKAWPARTDVAPIRGDDALTLVRLRMRTGVTHQLRVHLATLGHPILGDRRYGARAGDPAIVPPPGAWHFLHAWRLAFDDPALPRGIATAFPAHWRPLFAARGWSTEIDA